VGDCFPVDDSDETIRVKLFVRRDSQQSILGQGENIHVKIFPRIDSREVIQEK